MQNKTYFKKQMLSLRDAMDKAEVSRLSAMIFKNVLALNSVRQAKNIFIYSSFKNEVCTKDAIDELLKTKNVYIPRINSDDTMSPVRISKDFPYYINRYGICEPIGGEPCDKKIIDLCIVPGTVFDKFGGRAGYGKAYYDIFLRGTSIYKVAVCYDFQIIDYLPVDMLDVSMDCIVSEKRTITINEYGNRREEE